jgi:hypothetical protein
MQDSSSFFGIPLVHVESFKNKYVGALEALDHSFVKELSETTVSHVEDLLEYATFFHFSFQ